MRSRCDPGHGRARVCPWLQDRSPAAAADDVVGNAKHLGAVIARPGTMKSPAMEEASNSQAIGNRYASSTP